ncbi:MAG: ABC transporter ATP-binding protein [Veillonellales bacterium]
MLEAQHIFLDFGDQPFFQDLSLVVEAGMIVSIIGPNGSGKSTLLKALSRKIKPQQGVVLLDGRQLHSYSAVELACKMALLPQSPQAPGDITVYDLIQYGRFPHQRWWRNTREEDGKAIEWALTQTGLTRLAGRLVGTLSGGERQRVWLAMALAQKPRLLLLDEPTTYLDISHQLEILTLISQLNKQERITVVMVLHDINQAARYSDCIAVLQHGGLYAVGTPAEVITPRTLESVFRVKADIWPDEDNRPVCIARGLAVPGEELSGSGKKC